MSALVVDTIRRRLTSLRHERSFVSNFQSADEQAKDLQQRIASLQEELRQLRERDGKLDRQIAELEAWLAIHDPRPEAVEDEA